MEKVKRNFVFTVNLRRRSKLIAGTQISPSSLAPLYIENVNARDVNNIWVPVVILSSEMLRLNTLKEFSGKSNGGASVLHFIICACLVYGRLGCYGLCQICYTGIVYH